MRRYKNYKRKRRERKGYFVRRTVYTNDPEANAQVRYPDNYVQTTRYNPITFIPKNLWEQFHRVANVFFVLTAILTLLPTSPVIPGPQLVAVCSILVFQMIKDGYEDSLRRKSDHEINARPAWVVRSGATEAVEIPWSDIQVGDILRVENGNEIPADLLLISTSKENGQCFLETSNLDGETNLKLRSAHPQTSKFTSIEDLVNLKLTVDADEPCVRLYEFDGSIVVDDSEEFPLTIDNFLHRGTTLRDTEYIYGLVLYTGPQTKYMLNSSRPRHKISKLEGILNVCIIAIIVILVIMCVGSALMGVILYQYDIAVDHWYIIYDKAKGEGADAILTILTFIVSYANLVPLSLYVSLEVTRLIQARMLEADWYLYDRERKRQTLVRSSNLIEELGQIDYIFSDKTGTLTRNEMVFRVCAVGGQLFGQIPALAHQKAFDEEEYVSHLRRAEDAADESGEGGEEMNEIEKVPLLDEEVFDEKVMAYLDPKNGGGGGEGENDVDVIEEEDENGVKRKGSPKKKIDGGGLNDVQSMFLSLALCNTVVPATMNDQIIYQSSSPDETALVMGAKKANYVLVSRSVDECVVSIFGEDQTFEILAVNEFTPERRRMSVIVRMPNGAIQIFVKGADEAVFPLCDENNDASQTRADEFASSGLRTLVFAHREIPEKEFDEWAENHWNVARLATDDRKKQLLEAASLVEKDLRVVGVTGIEDRLQDDVPRTIDDLMKANIKVWVLTGDKGQTAINIAQACCLIKPEYKMCRIKVEGASDLDNVLSEVEKGIEMAEENDTVLVIDGRAVAHILEVGREDDLVRLGNLCKSVVCCRSTPIQKQQLVVLMKTKLPIRTLAIGDGANDVAMIQAAHVGVGVMGNEGMQAVMSADFVIGKFRFLRRLLILHGRWNYQRTGFMVCYVVYKNAFLTLMPLWFCIFSMWSGQVYIDPWITSMWDFFLTGTPIVLYSFLEQDLPAYIVLENPQLYIAGQKNEFFNWKMFFQWFSYALWDGIICFFGVIPTNYGFGKSVGSNGHVGDLYSCSTLTYTIMCLVANIHLFFYTRYWNCLTQWTYWLTVFSWFPFGVLFCTQVSIGLGSGQMYWVAFVLYSTPLYWITIPIICWLALLPDFLIVYIRRTFFPKPYHILQEVANLEDMRRDHPATGKWCCEEGDCCGCCACWCNC